MKKQQFKRANCLSPRLQIIIDMPYYFRPSGKTIDPAVFGRFPAVHFYIARLAVKI